MIFFNQPETTKVAIVERQQYTVSGGSNEYIFFCNYSYTKKLKLQYSVL